ncbi:MAG: Small heat shock protein HSP16.5 [Methanosaeta sp. PtaU1.Bin060]|nr:MAG: Small heat shock protein HSP16.5 [Methanosaeta sp. PtaU1.Bin060]
MAGLIPADEMKKLQKRMNRLLEDLGLSDLESKYLDELQRLQKRMSELAEEVEGAPMAQGTTMPLADVRETDEAVVVTMDLPGVEKGDIDITVTDNNLRVVAEREAEKEVDEKDYHRRERTCRRFERMVSLPVAVKTEEAKAKLDGGVLVITLPKEAVTSRKRISID